MCPHGRLFRRVDEGSVCTDRDEIGRRGAKLGENLVHAGGGFALLFEVCAGGDFVDSEWIRRTCGSTSLRGKEDGAGAFAHDRSAWRFLKRLDWRGGTKESPFVVGVAKQPVGFLGADDEAVIERV